MCCLFLDLKFWLKSFQDNWDVSKLEKILLFRAMRQAFPVETGKTSSVRWKFSYLEWRGVVLVSTRSHRPVSAQDGAVVGNISVSETLQSLPVYDVCLPSCAVWPQRRKWSLISIIFQKSVMNSAVWLSLPLLFTKIGKSNSWDWEERQIRK